MAEAKETPEAQEAEAVELSLLDQIVAEGRFGKDAVAQERGRDIIKQFVSQVLEGTVTMDRRTEAVLQERIKQIDRLVSAQVDEIMHAKEFQELEASWRGLHYLLSQTETGELLQVKVLNVSKKELLRDFKSAPGFDQSVLFKKVYEEEYGTFGGAPIGALLGNYEFSKGGEDIACLEGISNVAAAAFAPFITAASSDMFGLESFTALDDPVDMASVMTTTEYARWKAFRETEDSRYVALTLPRMLLREPFGSETVPIEAFDYEEQVSADHEKYLWGNSAWALGARVNQAFAAHGWCACIRGVESGGLVEGLPVHTFRTDAGDVAMKCPTETPITDRRENELAELGFAPLVHCKGTPDAAFFSVQSSQKPKKYQQADATANARISAQLPYIFAISRFAHYMKCMMRDKIGGYMSKAQAKDFLSKWISQYVESNPDAPPARKAKAPLAEARIDVEEIPGKPGAYNAIAFLKPHFQLEELTVSMRLVAELPPPLK